MVVAVISTAVGGTPQASFIAIYSRLVGQGRKDRAASLNSLVLVAVILIAGAAALLRLLAVIAVLGTADFWSTSLLQSHGVFGTPAGVGIPRNLILVGAAAGPAVGLYSGAFLVGYAAVVFGLKIPEASQAWRSLVGRPGRGLKSMSIPTGPKHQGDHAVARELRQDPALLARVVEGADGDGAGRGPRRPDGVGLGAGVAGRPRPHSGFAHPPVREDEDGPSGPLGPPPGVGPTVGLERHLLLKPLRTAATASASSSPRRMRIRWRRPCRGRRARQ